MDTEQENEIDMNLDQINDYIIKMESGVTEFNGDEIKEKIDYLKRVLKIMKEYGL